MLRRVFSFDGVTAAQESRASETVDGQVQVESEEVAPHMHDDRSQKLKEEASLKEWNAKMPCMGPVNLRFHRNA